LGESTPDNSGPWRPDLLLGSRFRLGRCVRHSGTCDLWQAQDVFRQTPQLLLRPSLAAMKRGNWLTWFEEFCAQTFSVPPHRNLLVAERMTGDGDLPFMVMEGAVGRCWDHMIEDGSITTLPAMLGIAIQTAAGLAWLHGQDRLHYNFKPASVLICESGLVKVWKFGERSAMTKAYAAPEQMAGRQLTEACDVWCWATSVLHMFMGKVAWRSGPMAPAALQRYRSDGPARSGIALMPGTLMETLEMCLVEDPLERSIRMEEVREMAEGVYELAIGRGYTPPPPPQKNAASGTGDRG